MSTHTLAAPAGVIRSGARHRRTSILWGVALCVLMPATCILYVLASGYSAITERVYSGENGITGELLPHHSAGQTFRARYAGLEGVSVHIGTYGDAGRTGAVLHLKRDTHSADIRTVAVAASDLAGRDPWYTFRFAPIEASQDQPFYAEVESPGARPGNALTLFQRQSADGADTYPNGNAYLDGRPQPGDLAFGLVYAPSPRAAFAQVARSVSANAPLWLVAALALLFALGIALLLPVLFARGTLGAAMLRFALPSLLVIGLAHGLLYALITPPWQGPDEPSHFAYAALLDKYGLNNAVVQGLDWQHGAQDQALIAAIATSMNTHSFTRSVAGYSAPGAPADPGTSVYSELRQPPLYYWLGAAGMRVARALGFQADPYANPEGALLVLRFVSVLLSLGVLTLAWLAGKLFASHYGGHRLMPALLTLTVALLPMHAFASGMANNDILAELAVSAIVVALLGLIAGRGAARQALFLGALLFATLACTQTKSSAVAAALPLLVLGLVAWLACRLSPRVRCFYPAAAGVSLLLLAGLLLSGVLSTPLGTASSWHLNKQPVDKAPIALTSTAHDGRYVLSLARNNNAWQTVNLSSPQASGEVFLTGYARPRAESLTGATAVVRLELESGGKVSVPLRGHAWTPFSVSAKVSPGSTGMNVRLYARDGGVEFDGLQLSGAPLANASFEAQEIGPRGILKRLPEEARWIWITMSNPQPFTTGTLWLGYAGAQFRSFWGNFGWVSVPLPGAWYLFWGAVSLLALLSQVALFKRTDTRTRALIALFLGSLVLTVLFGFARQTMLLSVFNVEAYPQGRYLFVLSIPLAWLLVSGLGEMYARLKVLLDRALVLPTEANRQAGIAAWTGINVLLCFSMFALLCLVIPYFYA